MGKTRTKRTALVVGCGSIGQRHARLISEHADIEVWACDPVESNLREVAAKARIARTFVDHKAALGERPDLVWVCTPNRLHAPVAVDALDAGADVLCEKPLSDTIEAAQTIVDAVEATGRTLLVGYTMRWFPGFQFIDRVVEEGQLGTIFGARVRLHGYRSLEVARTDYRRYEKAALLLDYSHEIDYLRRFLGDVAEAKAFSATMGHRQHIISPNVVTAILRFANGPLATLHFDYIQKPGARELDIFADGGMIHYDTNDDYLSFYQGLEGHCEHVAVKPADYDDPYRAEIQAFLDAVDGKSPTQVSAKDGLAVLKAVYAIVDSYESADGTHQGA
jgi:UDP-N-acetylglucosamine 3-dehydrogenase